MNLVLRSHNGFPFPFVFDRTSANRSFDRAVDRVIDSYFAPVKNTVSGNAISPRINVVESGKAYTVEAELPGVAKENVKISVNGNVVTLEAEVKHGTERKEGENVVFAERTVEKFARSFTLPLEVDDAQGTAKLENGVLTLTLPKKEALQPRQIQVQ